MIIVNGFPKISPALIKEGNTFIKNAPTYLLVLNEDNDINNVLSNTRDLFKHVPYIFIINLSNHSYDLYELQFYSSKTVLVSSYNRSSRVNKILCNNIFERRSNFNGALVRTSILEGKPCIWKGGDGKYTGILGSLLTLVQERFNFTIEYKEFDVYGVLNNNGSWTGVMRDLIDNKIDFSKYQKH